MSTKPEETYRFAGGITVTDADLEADAQRFEAGECDGAWKVLPECPRLSVRNKSRSARACPSPSFASSTRWQGNSDKLVVSLFAVSFITACWR
jgi:hypothetical protein